MFIQMLGSVVLLTLKYTVPMYILSYLLCVVHIQGLLCDYCLRRF